jgi:hypothetical protein
MQLVRAAATSPVISCTVRGARQPGLAVAAVALEHRVEIGQGSAELVGALAQRRAQHQNREGRLRLRPPGCQRRLGIAEIARVAVAPALFDVALGQHRGQGEVARIGTQRRAQAPQLAPCGIGAAGQALEHLCAPCRNRRRRARAPQGAGEGAGNEALAELGLTAGRHGWLPGSGVFR